MLYSYFKLIFVFACKSNIFFAHMQVISSFLLILLENPPYPPSTCSFFPNDSPSLAPFPLLTHLQLAPFFNQSSQNHKKRSKLPLYLHLSLFHPSLYIPCSFLLQKHPMEHNKKEQAALFQFLLFTLLFTPLTHT